MNDGMWWLAGPVVLWLVMPPALWLIRRSVRCRMARILEEYARGLEAKESHE